MGGTIDGPLRMFQTGEAMQSVLPRSDDYSLQMTVAIDLSGTLGTTYLNTLKVRGGQPIVVSKSTNVSKNGME